jgi:hypothetical protein
MANMNIDFGLLNQDKHGAVKLLAVSGHAALFDFVASSGRRRRC